MSLFVICSLAVKYDVPAAGGDVVWPPRTESGCWRIARCARIPEVGVSRAFLKWAFLEQKPLHHFPHLHSYYTFWSILTSITLDARPGIHFLHLHITFVGLLVTIFTKTNQVSVGFPCSAVQQQQWSEPGSVGFPCSAVQQQQWSVCLTWMSGIISVHC